MGKGRSFFLNVSFSNLERIDFIVTDRFVEYGSVSFSQTSTHAADEGASARVQIAAWPQVKTFFNRQNRAEHGTLILSPMI